MPSDLFGVPGPNMVSNLLPVVAVKLCGFGKPLALESRPRALLNVFGSLERSRRVDDLATFIAMTVRVIINLSNVCRCCIALHRRDFY